MSYLCMDENGNVYVAATHRSDGQGVESRPIESANFEEKNFQNPYLAQDQAAHAEGSALAALNIKMDVSAQKEQAKRAKAFKAKKAQEALAVEVLKNNQDKLLAAAITQQMNGADFNQLSIVDAQYGARHAAILQGMGEAPADSDVQYIQDGEYVSPMEQEQLKMTSYATNQIMSEAKKQALEAEKTMYAAPAKSVLDPITQEKLTGEINFDSEDEANTFAKMTSGQQIAYLRAKLSDQYLPSTSEASAMASPANNKMLMYGGLAALAYLLLK